MYELKESTAEEIAARSLVRVSEVRKDEARFFGPQEPILIDFQDEGIHPLRDATIYRKIYSRPHRGSLRPIISLTIFGFDEAHRGTDRAVLRGFWGSEIDFRSRNRGMVRYRGGIELLPEGFVDDALALLDHRGGIDLELAPWEIEEIKAERAAQNR